MGIYLAGTLSPGTTTCRLLHTCNHLSDGGKMRDPEAKNPSFPDSLRHFKNCCFKMTSMVTCLHPLFLFRLAHEAAFTGKSSPAGCVCRLLQAQPRGLKNTYYISQGKRTTCLCSLGDQTQQSLNTWLMSPWRGPEAVNLNVPDGSWEEAVHNGRGVKKGSQGADVY